MKIINFLKNWQTRPIKLFKNLEISWKRLSIRKKIFVSSFAIIISLVFLIDFLILSYQEQTLKKEIYNRLRSHLNALAYEIIDYIVFLDPLKLDEKISF
ncbi:hypothetical protein [Thermodesulfobacterium hydrogeniphilum]|uniref:hypothetical protein n=1 Tax=Thermodesulfobacterium hydrogeniphilum TaxID=161156 RepID=UPI000A8A372C|nr:hypothetical protein [Thermodesulfobacterium hydrogeniphilum]